MRGVPENLIHEDRNAKSRLSGRNRRHAKLTPKQKSDAAEMLVAAEITLRGDIPTFIVPANWPDYDVIAELPDHSRQRISVKSRKAGGRNSHIDFNPTTFDWMAIVFLDARGDREIFIAPSDILSKPQHSTQRPHWKRNPRSLRILETIPAWLLKYKDNFSLKRYG